MTKAEMEFYRDKLFDIDANNLCPFCDGDKFSMMSGYFKMQVFDSASIGNYVSDEVLPCIAIICEKCAFVRHHASLPLGEKNE